MTTIPNTPMGWVKEYTDSVDGIYKIMKSVQNGETQTIHDFASNSLLLMAYRATKAEAERQILNILGENNSIEIVEEMLTALAPYMEI